MTIFLGRADSRIALDNAENMTATQISKMVKRMKVIMTKAALFGDRDMVTVVEMWELRLTELRDAVEKGKAENASE